MQENKATNELQSVTDTVAKTFADFGIEMEVKKAYEGFHYYHIRMVPKRPVRMQEIRGFVDDLRFALGKYVVKIEAPVKLEKEIAVKVIRENRRQEIHFSDINDEIVRQATTPLTVPLGVNEERQFKAIDLAQAPNLLIGGRSCAGKTNFLHGLINSLILRNDPEKVRLVLVNPKPDEFSRYKNLPHLLTNVITNSDQAIRVLKWVNKEMERRHDILEAHEAMNITEYHTKLSLLDRQNDSMPYIVIVMDEMADVMSDLGHEAENLMCSLAKMSQAVGIHMVLSTQSDKARILRGRLKANIPNRIAFSCDSVKASKAIIDQAGAEELVGRGSALHVGPEDYRVEEVQTAKIEDKMIDANVIFLKRKFGVVDDNDIDLKTIGDYMSNLYSSDDEDELYEDARQAVLEARKASTSYLQRKFRIGYSRAARLMDMLEERGVIGPADGASPREILE